LTLKDDALTFLNGLFQKTGYHITFRNLLFYRPVYHEVPFEHFEVINDVKIKNVEDAFKWVIKDG
jgi:hypothetical protein